jgi:hypothetical protein
MGAVRPRTQIDDSGVPPPNELGDTGYLKTTKRR